MDEADAGPYAGVLHTLKTQINEYLAGDTSTLFDSVELHMMQFWTGCRRQGLDGTWVEPDLELVREFCENSLAGIEWLEDYLAFRQEGASVVRVDTIADRVDVYQVVAGQKPQSVQPEAE